jgi:hypothetical protein
LAVLRRLVRDLATRRDVLPRDLRKLCGPRGVLRAGRSEGSKLFRRAVQSGLERAIASPGGGGGGQLLEGRPPPEPTATATATFTATATSAATVAAGGSQAQFAPAAVSSAADPWGVAARARAWAVEEALMSPQEAEAEARRTQAPLPVSCAVFVLVGMACLADGAGRGCAMRALHPSCVLHALRVCRYVGRYVSDREGRQALWMTLPTTGCTSHRRPRRNPRC